jgi:hypothetical protein
MTAIDEAKLHEFVARVLGDLGGAFSVALVRMGVALGLYRTLRDVGPATSAELATCTGLAERYLREWLAHQAASGYLSYDSASRRFTLSPEQAAVLADEDSPFHMAGAFDVAVALLDNQAKVQTAFGTGEGVAWGEQAACVFCATARCFRPAYAANLALQLQGVFEVSPLRHGLMTSSPDGPGDDERRLDPALR